MTTDHYRQAAEAALTYGRVAQRLGVDVLTVRRWARTEQMPTVRVGHATRVPAEWVAQQEALLAAAIARHPAGKAVAR
jgi:excisionase family DNA binding protein